MLTTLHTTYTDTRAGDLAWCLGSERLPALAVLDLRLGAVELELRLLGASHQVILGDRHSETVACLPGRRTPLPARVAERMHRWDYEFAARIEQLTAAQFAVRAQELLALVEHHPHALAGIFPGDPNAFTALVAGGGESKDAAVHWRTWHAYPQEGQLVCTRSTLRPHRRAERQSGARDTPSVGGREPAKGSPSVCM
ncbi:DUF2617 family protein [Streptacidiphilus monticola]|uniref:DUF2617 family protein n=1 Tax=Streptacidiphilus monticola TaxID=2161674 RepID=A0ABW1G4F2_9ACTN